MAVKITATNGVTLEVTHRDADENLLFMPSGLKLIVTDITGAAVHLDLNQTDVNALKVLL